MNLCFVPASVVSSRLVCFCPQLLRGRRRVSGWAWARTTGSRRRCLPVHPRRRDAPGRPLSIWAAASARCSSPNGNTLGIPIDLVAEGHSPPASSISRALSGPGSLRGRDLRAHAAFGFGIQGGALSFGLEVGYLEPEPIIGLRLGYRF